MSEVEWIALCVRNVRHQAFNAPITAIGSTVVGRGGQSVGHPCSIDYFDVLSVLDSEWQCHICHSNVIPASRVEEGVFLVGRILDCKIPENRLAHHAVVTVQPNLRGAKPVEIKVHNYSPPAPPPVDTLRKMEGAIKNGGVNARLLFHEGYGGYKVLCEA
jgi:hypothetical protein